MDRTACRWVCQRLPLFVEDREGLPGDQGDLSVEDQVRIEQHLLQCAACRSRRSALADVLAILSLAAEEAPAGPDPGPSSILPAVQEQIRRHPVHPRTAWGRTWRALGLAKRVGSLTAPLEALARCRSELPLQVAWFRDSLRERADRAAFRLQTLGSGPWRFAAPRLDLRAAAVMAAMVLGALLLAGFMRDRQAEAEAQIAANAVPIPGMNIPVRDLQTELDALAPIAVADADADAAAEARRDIPAATAEPLAISLAVAGTTTLQPPPARPAGAGASNPTGTAAAPSATATAPRYNFDLEHGTPMPPETRGGKPAY